jgi:hypothetical protein
VSDLDHSKRRASDGTLVYLPLTGVGGGIELVWVDRVTGEETPLAAPLRGYVQPRISRV